MTNPKIQILEAKNKLVKSRSTLYKQQTPQSTLLNFVTFIALIFFLSVCLIISILGLGFAFLFKDLSLPFNYKQTVASGYIALSVFFFLQIITIVDLYKNLTGFNLFKPFKDFLNIKIEHSYTKIIQHEKEQYKNEEEKYNFQKFANAFFNFIIAVFFMIFFTMVSVICLFANEDFLAAVIFIGVSIFCSLMGGGDMLTNDWFFAPPNFYVKAVKFGLHFTNFIILGLLTMICIYLSKIIQ